MKNVVDIKNDKIEGFNISVIKPPKSLNNKTEKQGNVLSFPQNPQAYRSPFSGNVELEKHGIVYHQLNVPPYLSDFSGNPQNLFYIVTSPNFSKRFYGVREELILCIQSEAQVKSGSLVLFVESKRYQLGEVFKDEDIWMIQNISDGKTFVLFDMVIIGKVDGFCPYRGSEEKAYFINDHPRRKLKRVQG